MDRLRRDAILIRLINALQERGSWCGETHIQKAAYLLQEMAKAETDFEFMLYKHGPFSFEFRDELSAMRADGLVSLQVKDRAYGPSIVLEEAASKLCKRFPKTLRKHKPKIEFIADCVGNKQVVELERLGTAFYVTEELGPKAPADQRAERVHALKRHVSVDDALRAVQTVDNWRQQASELYN